MILMTFSNWYNPACDGKTSAKPGSDKRHIRLTTHASLQAVFNVILLTMDSSAIAQ